VVIQVIVVFQDTVVRLVIQEYRDIVGQVGIQAQVDLVDIVVRQV